MFSELCFTPTNQGEADTSLGKYFEDWEVKTCFADQLFYFIAFTMETGPGIVLSWKSGSLFSVPSHWWELWWKVNSWAEINPLQAPAWHLFLPWDPQDPTRMRLHCPLPSQHLRTCSTLFPSWKLSPIPSPAFLFPPRLLEEKKEGILAHFFSGKEHSLLFMMYRARIFCVCHITHFSPEHLART